MIYQKMNQLKNYFQKKNENIEKMEEARKATKKKAAKKVEENNENKKTDTKRDLEINGIQ